MASFTQAVNDLLAVQAEHLTTEEIYQILISPKYNADAQYVLKTIILESKEIGSTLSSMALPVPAPSDDWKDPFLHEACMVLRRIQKKQGIPDVVPWETLLTADDKQVVSELRNSFFEIVYTLNMDITQIKKLRLFFDEGFNLHSPGDLAAFYCLTDERIHDYKSHQVLESAFGRIKNSIKITPEELARLKGKKKDDDYSTWIKPSSLTEYLKTQDHSEKGNKSQKELLDDRIHFIEQHKDIFLLHDSQNNRNLAFAMLNDILRLLNGSYEETVEEELLLSDLESDYDHEELHKAEVEARKENKKKKERIPVLENGHSMVKGIHMKTIRIGTNRSKLIRALFADVFETRKDSTIIPKKTELESLNLPLSLTSALFEFTKDLRYLTILEEPDTSEKKKDYTAHPVTRREVLLLGMFMLFLLQDALLEIACEQDDFEESKREMFRKEKISRVADMVQSLDEDYVSDLIDTLWQDVSGQEEESPLELKVGDEGKTVIRFLDQLLVQSDFFPVYLPYALDRMIALLCVQSNPDHDKFTALADLFDYAGY